MDEDESAAADDDDDDDSTTGSDESDESNTCIHDYVRSRHIRKNISDRGCNKCDKSLSKGDLDSAVSCAMCDADLCRSCYDEVLEES